MPAAPPPVQPVPSDVALLAGVAAGDRAAFAALFERYAGRLKAHVLRAGAGRDDADEIVQDVMVSVWRRAASFDPDRAAVSTWIYAIARNRRIDGLRRAHRPRPDPLDPTFDPEPEPDGLDRVSRVEREAALRAVLADLAPEQRAVLVAAFYDGRSHAEIAAALGLPLGTVKSRIRLAFQRLRGALGDDFIKELTNE